MERRRLGTLLHEANLSADLAQRPELALALLEARARHGAADRAGAAAQRALLDRIVAASAPPSSLRAESSDLLRWDEVSVVWTGPSIQTGQQMIVRALRPHMADNPAARRFLRSEAVSLGAVLSMTVDEAVPALLMVLPGCALGKARGDALVRPLLTGLAALSVWEQSKLGLPPLLPEELRLVDGQVVITCATPIQSPLSLAIASLAEALVDPLDDTALAATIRAFGEHPPDTVADAARIVRSAIAEHLTARRHGLAARWRETWHRAAEARLSGVVERLFSAVGPPSGRGAVGVDLEGRITVLDADAAGIRWGPEREVETVFDWAEGFRPIAARRLLRARAVSPPNPSLDARIGGDSAATDAICRWVAAGLRLRTVQMLLARERA